MPSVLWRAIGAVKDKASIGIAKLSTASTSGLEVAIVRATSHDGIPPADSLVAEVLVQTLSAASGAAECVRLLTRRVARTRTWTVALKSLFLAHRCMCEAGPDFWREASALTSPTTGASLLLDLANFSDTSSATSPWDYTAFVRTFARYLDTRLASARAGRLSNLHRRGGGRHASLVTSMGPPAVLEHVRHWQRLLARAIGTRPTGPARISGLVRASLHAVVRESFDLYCDVSAGLSLLLDSFFRLPHEHRVETFYACSVAVKQFEELDAFYALCKSIGLGRLSEYPSVQTITGELVRTLEDFLVDGRPSRGTQPKLALRSSSRPSSGGCRPHASISSTVSAPETGVDRYSALARCHAVSARVSTSSDTEAGARQTRAISDSTVLRHLPGNSDEPDSTGWERLLIESAKIMSGHGNGRQVNPRNPFQSGEQSPLVEGGGRHVYGRKQFQSDTQRQHVLLKSTNIIENHQRDRSISQEKESHQGHWNPFLQDCNQMGMEMISWQEEAPTILVPTFQAGMATETNASGAMDPFAVMETISLLEDASMKQLIQLY